MKLFETLKDLAESGYIFRIQDNGGATADRYAVVFCDGDYLGMSGAPSHPQGVSMWGEKIDPLYLDKRIDEETAVDLAIGDLPEHIALHVLARVNEAWADVLERIQSGDPGLVSASREDANENEGIHTSAGEGLFKTGDGFWVKMEETEKDAGPFATAREALLASLPTAYSLSGPEFHSNVDVGRLEPDYKVAAKVAELEAAVEATPAPGR